MKLSRTIKTWVRTRPLRKLLHSLPALLALVAAIIMAAWLSTWRPGEAMGRYALLSDRALAQKDFETARVASRRCLAMRANPRNKWLFNLALAMAGLDRAQEASALFAAAAPPNKPGYLPAHLFLAQALLAKTNLTQNDLRAAEVHLNHVVSLDPESVEAKALLANIYIRREQWGPASDRLREIVAVKPECGLFLAQVLKARGDSLGAQGWAQRAVTYHRDQVQGAKLDQPAHRLALAEAMMLLENYEAAFAVLEEGYKQAANPLYPPALGQISAAWGNQMASSKPQDLETRLRLLQQGLRYAPENQTLLKQLIGLSRLERAEAHSAREILANELVRGKSLALIHFLLGLDAWEHRQADSAREHFFLAFDSAPLMPEVANNMAMILAVGDQPDLPKALALIQTVLDRFPNHPNFRETRGQILAKMGRWHEAVSDLEFALPLVHSAQSTHATLASAYRGLGMEELALKHEGLAKPAGGDK